MDFAYLVESLALNQPARLNSMPRYLLHTYAFSRRTFVLSTCFYFSRRLLALGIAVILESVDVSNCTECIRMHLVFFAHLTDRTIFIDMRTAKGAADTHVL